MHLDHLALSPRYQDHAKSSKALTLVWIASSVEAFWKAYLKELMLRVTSAPLSKRRRHLSVASIFYFDVLSSMGDGKRLRRWDRTADFFAELRQVTPGSAPALPYDGRTIRPEHFALAWKLFHLPGLEFPTPIHKQELITLADRRNDVAHGHLTPQVVGGYLSVGDLKKLVTRIEDIVDHSVIAASRRWP